jgi:thiamine kinase-like enzyme
VPDPLPITGVDGFDAWGQSFAAGTALERLASPERLVDDGAAMTNWTIALARATRSTMPVDTVKSLRKAVEKVAIGLSDLADGQQLAQAVLASFDRLNPTAAVRCHGDLGPWNIHVDKGGRPTVIDWADSVEAGLPMSDLIHFIAHLSLQAYDAYGRDRRSHVVSELMDPAATCGRLMIKQTGVYAGGLGMDSGRIDDYRLVTWALDLHDRPSSKWETDVYLELLRAEVRRITSNP